MDPVLGSSIGNEAYESVDAALETLNEAGWLHLPVMIEADGADVPELPDLPLVVVHDRETVALMGADDRIAVQALLELLPLDLARDL